MFEYATCIYVNICAENKFLCLFVLYIWNIKMELKLNCKLQIERLSNGYIVISNFKRRNTLKTYFMRAPMHFCLYRRSIRNIHLYWSINFCIKRVYILEHIYCNLYTNISYICMEMFSANLHLSWATYKY